MHRTRGLAAPRFRAGEPRTRREPDRDMQFPSAVLLVTELHARHPPRVRQLQGGGEQRRGIHTPKLPDQHHHPPDPLTHTKQRKASRFFGIHRFRYRGIHQSRPGVAAMVVATPGRHCLDWFSGSGVPVCIGFGIYRFRYFGMRHTSGFVRDSVRARHWPVIVAVRMTASRSVCGFNRCILCVASFFFGRFGHVECFVLDEYAYGVS